MRDPEISQYSLLSQTLHWLVVSLILGQWLSAELAELTDSRATTLALLALHKSLGMTVLLMAIVRLLYRLSSRQPAYPEPLPHWQQNIANILHWALYTLIFALPLSGWLGSSASAYSVSWFNLFTFPDLVAPDETLKKLLFGIHEWCWHLLCILVVIHIAAAIKHHFIDKDKVLAQMSSKLSLAVGTLGIIVVATIIGNQWLAINSNKVRVNPNTNMINLEEQPAEITSSGLLQSSKAHLWKVDYNASYIKFSTRQAGAEFTGRFNQWKTQVALDINEIHQGSIETTIELNSVYTEDQERDDTLATPEFFATALYPKATFKADSFNLDPSSNTIHTNSVLEIKGKTYPIDFSFKIEKIDSSSILKGSAKLDRLQLKIGTGEWLDTSWIDQYVEVNVLVRQSNK